MARGDHIYVERPLGYTHHGIDLGDGTVIHFSGEPGGNKLTAHVCRSSIEEFAGAGEVKVRRYAVCAPPDEIVIRAEARLDECGYHLVFNNCEHFARWCVTGRHASAQVNGVMAAGGVGVTTISASKASAQLIAVTGLTPGVSAPGIMSGLARIGSVVGGGAVAGLVVIGGFPALVSAGIMNVALSDDQALLDETRAARRVGRRGAVVGGAAGTAAGIAAVHGLGVAGLSGAGISSGLAAVGAWTGGGMFAGALTIAVVPAALAALGGYIAYKIAEHYAQRQPPPAPQAPQPA